MISETGDLDRLWLQKHSGIVKYARRLKQLLDDGTGLNCESCGQRVDQFFITQQGMLCQACHLTNGQTPINVRSLVGLYLESLVLLRNYHLFMLGLYVFQEELARVMPQGDEGNGERLLKSMTGKQWALIEVKHLVSLINDLSEGAKRHGIKVNLDTAEINLTRVQEILAILP